MARCAGDDVEEDVPLCPQQHQRDAADGERHVQQDQQHRHQRKEHRRGKAGDHLDDRLQALRPSGDRPIRIPTGSAHAAPITTARCRAHERREQRQHDVQPVVVRRPDRAAASSTSSLISATRPSSAPSAKAASTNPSQDRDAESLADLGDVRLRSTLPGGSAASMLHVRRLRRLDAGCDDRQSK